MPNAGTLTRADIAERLNQEIGLSKAESATLLDQVLDNITDALVRGENVKLSGFGSFLLRDKKERIGRNPKTGVEVPITPRRVLTFRASQMARESIIKGS